MLFESDARGAAIISEPTEGKATVVQFNELLDGILASGRSWAEWGPMRNLGPLLPARLRPILARAVTRSLQSEVRLLLTLIVSLYSPSPP